MNKTGNTKETVDIIKKFIEHKYLTIPFLDQIIAPVVTLKTNKDQEFDELYENYINNLIMTIKFSDVKNFDYWTKDSFENFFRFLYYKSNLYGEKSLVISYSKHSGDKTFSQEVMIEKFSLDDILSWENLEVNINIKIISKNPGIILEINNGKPSLYKKDIDEIIEIETLDNIANLLDENKIVSEDVQNILLGFLKIKKYSFWDSNSIYLEKKLDQYQKNAFKLAKGSNDILLIKGPPGTGKSTLITALLKHLVFIDHEKVIIASQTHAALDNVIENISVTSSQEFSENDSYSGIIFKKSSSSKINQYHRFEWMLKTNIRKNLLYNAPKNGAVLKLLKTSHSGIRGLKRFIPSEVKVKPRVFFSTIASKKLEMSFKNDNFFKESILIMDEVSKISISDVLRFSTYAKKIILIGDEMQLHKIIKSTKQIEDFTTTLNIDEKKLFYHLFQDSIFSKLFNKELKNNVILKNCYRSPKEIVDLYNGISYNNEIIPLGNKDPFYELNYADSNLLDFTKILNENATIFIDHKKSHKYIKTISNGDEVQMAANLINNLNSLVLNSYDKTLMLIFSYVSDKKIFEMDYKNIAIKSKRKFKSFNIGTVDSFQGREADIVIYCTGYNPNNQKAFRNNILNNLQRANVSLSRSKERLIVFGNKDVMEQIKFFDSSIKRKINFGWKDVLEKMSCKIEYKDISGVLNE